MHRRPPNPLIATAACIVISCSVAAGAENTPAKAGTPTKPAITMEAFRNYQCPEWYRDAKFGIWSHWGPDSVPGISNNYANEMYTQGGSSYRWHLEHYGHSSQVHE